MPESMDIRKVLKGLRKRKHVICLYKNNGIDRRGEPFDPPINTSMIRDERYKLNIYHKSPTIMEFPEGELFDLFHDPNELKNLYKSSEYTEIRATLTLELLEFFHKYELLLGSKGGEARPSEKEKIINTPK